MEASHLIWKEEKQKEVFRSTIFSVRDSECRSPEGENRHFTVIDAADWVIVVPFIETEKNFVMVRQWRHGSRELSLEFPGGVIENGETDRDGAARELEEETAFRAGTLIKLGEMSPNPAIMSNRVHFYCAGDLQRLASQRLDADEFVDVEIVPAKEALHSMGKPPFVHALTAAALMLFLGHSQWGLIPRRSAAVIIL